MSKKTKDCDKHIVNLSFTGKAPGYWCSAKYDAGQWAFMDPHHALTTDSGVCQKCIKAFRKAYNMPAK